MYNLSGEGEKMKIAIVEDEKVQQDYLSKMLQTIAEEKQLTLSLRV